MGKVCGERFFFFFCQIRMTELDPLDIGESLKILRVSMIILKKTSMYLKGNVWYIISFISFLSFI